MEKTYDHSIFTRRLAELLDAEKVKKRSASSIADAMGVQRSTLTKYKTGESLPPPNVLYDLSQQLNVSVDYLLGLTDAAPANPSKRAVCEATGLNIEAIKGLLRLTRDMPDSSALTKYDDYQTLDIISKTKPDEFCIRILPDANDAPEKVIQLAEPSRKTVINALLASAHFSDFKFL